jgi:hypothetical protein
MEATGQDTVLRIMSAGVVQSVFRDHKSVTFDAGIEVEVTNYVGQTAPKVRQIKNECTLESPFDPDSAAWLQLMDLARRKALGDQVALATTIDITLSVNFGSGVFSKVLITNAMIRGGGLEIGGRTDLVSASPTFVAAEWQLLA